jgi:hypothetical protein
MPGEKRHHYVPQLLLKRFCLGGLLWVFDRETGTLRQQPPKDTAVEKHRYSRPSADGKHDTSLEEFLSYIESKAAGPLEKLGRREELSLEERFYLSLFLGLLCLRGPDFEAGIREITDKGGKALLKELNRYGGLEEGAAEKGLDPEAVRDFIENEKFQIVPDKNYLLSTMTRGAMEVGKHFFVCGWSLGESPKDCCFVTSDVPYSLISMDPSQPAGLTAPASIRAIPIAPQLCIVIGPGPASLLFSPIPRDLVREINRDIAMGSDRFVFARDRAQLAALATRNRLGEWRRSERVHLQRVSKDGKSYILVANKETPDQPPAATPGRPRRL